MVSTIEGNTKALLSMALDATTMRQQAIAQNIANANTPGFQALDVSFEDQLSDIRGMLEQGEGVTSAALSGHRPLVVSAESNTLNGSNGSGVSLEMELAKLSENTLRQQVLLKMLNTHYAVMNSALK